MLLREKTPWQNKTVLFVIIVVAIWAFTFSPLRSTTSLSTSSKSPYAYVTLLNQNPDLDNKTVPDSEDEYFIATRTLAYQLLHAPETRTNHSIPFIVLATKDVAPHKIARLTADGATVKVVDSITASWLQPGLPRWRDQMCKLHIFGLTEYEKVLFLDSDMLIVKSMDGIFTDLTTSPQSVDQSLAVSDEASLPDTYMLAAQAYMEGRQHPYPPSSNIDHFSGGFMVAKPSTQMLAYYLSLIEIEGRFRSNAMEQDLLNYAHRRDGPMPWADVTYTWTTTWPSRKEYEAGAASLHEKWWVESITLDLGLRKMWYIVRGEMEGYWRGREGI